MRDFISRLFNHVRVSDVRVREDTDPDGDDVFRIDVIFDGTSSAASRAASGYRASDHRAARAACLDKTTIAKFPREIQEFSDAFVQLQLKRHEVDYDPDATMYDPAVLADIASVETVIGELSDVPLRHRRACAAWVMFKRRN